MLSVMAHQNKNNYARIPRPIANELTYTFIDCIEPGTVLTHTIDDDLLHTKNEINEPFLMTLYQKNALNKAAFFFAHKDQLNDAKKVFSIYRDNHHAADKFYGHLVIVNDITKFYELANKTSPGCATKGGNWYNDCNWTKGLSHFYDSDNGYTMLPRARVTDAINNVPKQTRSWSCGPNSGLRAIKLLDEQSYVYDSFVNCSPKYICKETTVNNGATTYAAGWGLTALGLIFAPVTGGLSLLPGAATAVAGLGTAATGAAISSDVGPIPSQLADYLKGCMKKHGAYETTYDSRSEYEESIAGDIRLGLPRIVLFIMGSFSMHYINVIGYKSNKDGKIEKWVILDTDGDYGFMSAYNFSYWLDHDCASWLLDKYNTIKFNWIFKLKFIKN